MTFFALLAATGHAIYQAYGEPGVTEWSVFYNANNYLLYAAIFYEQGEVYSERLRWSTLFRVICMFWMYSLIAEVRCLGMDYSDYRAAMSQTHILENINVMLLACVIIIIVDISKHAR